METKRVHRICKTEVIEVSRPSEEHPDLWQYHCPHCDPNRRNMFGKMDTELVESTGATYEDRVEMMKKEKEQDEPITYMSKDVPKIKPGWNDMGEKEEE